MARQDYMTIAVQKSTQEIFRKFVDIKGFTVKEALSDVLEMYMIAQDAQLYMTLKNDYKIYSLYYNILTTNGYFNFMITFIGLLHFFFIEGFIFPKVF